jgi:pyruvate formate lyase activating enzyme
MNIHGIIESSVIGDDIFSPTIFLKGCNLNCPYCINYKLVNGDVESYPLEKAISYIKENECKFVNISGGEPLLSDLIDLEELISKFNDLGCKVGLSTNGAYPFKLESLINKINYVALDVKSEDPSVYDRICNNDKFPFLNILTSLYVLKTNKKARQDFDFEVRTTVYPEFIDCNSIINIASLIGKGEKYFLQVYRNNEKTLGNCNDVKPYSKSEIDELLDIAKKSCKGDVYLRYV